MSWGMGAVILRGGIATGLTRGWGTGSARPSCPWRDRNLIPGALAPGIGIAVVFPRGITTG